MKKIIFAVLLTVVTFGFANAQSKKIVTKPATITNTTESSKSQRAHIVKSTPAATTATTKKTSKMAVNSKTVSTSSHMKSDGTPDKRYKENKIIVQHAKKNGTPGMRYKSNKK